MIRDLLLTPAAREALEAQFRLDREECGPKAPHGDISYKGVVLSSRFNVLREFEDMRMAVNLMPELMRRLIVSIYCNSNAGWDYIVMVKAWHSIWEDEIQSVFRKIRGGYNGLWIVNEDRNSLLICDPWWLEEDDPE